jgi:transposase-like protein
MKKQEFNQLLNTLCADELVELKSILEKNLNSIVTAKDSNHKIIKRERSVNCCPICGSNHIVKNGKRKDTNRQKYMCKACKASFSDTTNTIAFHSKKTYNTWENYISCLLKGMTLADTAKEIGISVTSSFAWRHKILKTLSKFNKNIKLKETIELDPIYFPINLKGTKKDKMPRYSKKRTSSAFRGISHHKVCVVTANDSQDNMLFEISGLGVETTEMLMKHKDRFESGSTLVTDSKRTFDKFASEKNMKHNYIPSKFYKSDSGHSLATLNGLHSELKTWLKKFKGVSTKHLQGYLDLFRYLKHLKYKIEYEKRISETYRFSIPSNMKVLINDIYNEDMPIDLKAAYSEYKFGIYA